METQTTNNEIAAEIQADIQIVADCVAAQARAP